VPRLDADEALLFYSHWSAITLIQTLQPDTTLHLLSMTRRNGFWAEQIFLDQRLLNSKKIYVFCCGATSLYALTADSTGWSLPTQACQAGWRFERSIMLQLDKNSPNYELNIVTLAAIATHGFYLTHAAIHAVPVATAHVGAKSTESAEQ
jgi:hypothetical protein